MITFKPYPNNNSDLNYVQPERNSKMVVDVVESQELDSAETRMLTCPGELLTSAQTYMRYGWNNCIVARFLAILVMQWPWNVY